MSKAELTVTLPEGTWIEDVSTSHPQSLFRVLAAMPDGDTGVGLVEIESRSMQSVLASMEAHDAIARLELFEGSESSSHVQFETTKPLLLFSAQESGIPLELPLEIQNGTTKIEVTASRSRLSELGAQLERHGLSYEVDRISQLEGSDRLLTDRQAELIRTALDRGYYDTPREASMTDLAEELDIAKSTCSETLHRAEEKIVKRHAEEHLEERSTPLPSP